MNNLNQLLLRRLKNKHNKLAARFQKGVEARNFQRLTGRKRYNAVERLKKIEKQLKELAQKTGFGIQLNFKHWAVALALGVVVTTASAQTKNEPKFPKKNFPGKSGITSNRAQGIEAQSIFFNEVQQLGEPLPYQFHTGDLDGDGDDDAIYVSYLDNPILIINDGGFTFTKSIINVANQKVVEFTHLGDFDADGDLDLLFIHREYYGAPIDRVLINDGAGNFTETVVDFAGLEVGQNASEFEDIDGDSDLDYVFVAYDSLGVGQINIFQNNALTFSSLSTATAYNNVTRLYTSGNIDGDSDMDLLYQSTDSLGVQSLRILRNDGSGVFSDAGISYVGSFNEVRTGDFDNDNDMDIALISSSYPNVLITPLIQSSPNIFTPTGTQLTATGAQYSEDVIVNDLDGDGNDEIYVTGERNQSFFFQNTGNATFATEQIFNGKIRSANLDANADLDLFILDGSLGTYANQGSFSFVKNANEILTVGASYDIDLVDIDLDGDLDIVQANVLRVWLNDGSGKNFTIGQENKEARHEQQIFGNLDADADSDMIALKDNVGSNYGGFDIWTNDVGTLSFSLNIGYGVYNVRDLKLMDLDGDTDLDIALLTRQGSSQYYLRTLINNGSLSFNQASNILLPSYSNNLSVGDLDADSDNDVVIIFGDSITTYLNNGAGLLTGFSSVVPNAYQNNIEELDLADLDGDGDLDIFASADGEAANKSFIFFNNGTGIFTEDSVGIAVRANSSVLGDLDNDGDIDVITLNYSNGNNVFLNDGSGVFSRDDVSLGVGDDSSKGALGHLDGDADLDFVLGGLYVANLVFLNGAAIESDSLALVDFYNATNGSSWTTNTNWTTNSIDTWFGVTITAGRVSDLSLPDNNLDGAIPISFNDLTELVNVDLSGNVINGIESDLSNLANLTSFDVSDNQLDFADFKLIGGLPGLVIGNQSTNDVTINQLVPAGSPVSFSFLTDSAGNDYQWFRNDAIEVGAITNTVDIASIDRTNMGVYYCVVTNVDVPGLTLTSATKTVLATASIDGKLKINNSDPATKGIVNLLQITNSEGYDTTAVVNINTTGDFIFNNVILNDYILVGIADTISHPDALPTYFNATASTPFWREADTLFVEGNATANITSIFNTNPTGDVGNFFGYLEEDIPDTGGRKEARERVGGAGVSMRRGRRTGRSEGSGELAYYVYTDVNGEFDIKGITPGDYNIDIQYPGYPMDENSFLDITIGDGPKDKAVGVEAVVLDGVIGVKQLIILSTDELISGISLYPNPANEILKITDKQNRKGLKAELLDLTGKKIKTLVFDKEGAINVAELPVGQYFVKITDNNDSQLSTQKIIIK